MTEAESGSSEPRERRWLRPLGLFVLALALAVGQPAVIVVVTFSFLTLLTPGGRVTALALAAVGFALVFAGEPGGGLWYLERGWALLVGGAFAAVSRIWPDRPFFPRALMALALGAGAAGIVLFASNGWITVERLMVGRIEAGVAATLEWIGPLGGGAVEPQLTETVARAAQVQGVVFPALVALSTLASMGVAWWLHLRIAVRSDRGLAPVREFRFADPLIWLLIVGAGLVLTAQWSEGWGRAGTNLVAFMGALYVLRGLGVLLFLLGGVSITGGLMFALALLLAGPVLLGGALVIGMGDSWLDLRARARAGREGPG